ncbi:MAG: transposase [Parcubacteria group bacterium]|nr:transposase [Parcubacteria group bacterium]MCR4342497.1 transposase [Patescibacteria group bacterium]
MERKIQFSIGEFYHIYNRGNDKRGIFLNGSDFERFMKLLFVCNNNKSVVFKIIQGVPLDRIDRGETLVDIGVYCLMPNHFHILVREKTEGGITKFLGKLSTGYSMYFNKKNERTGKLFEGVFKATHVDNDEYLKYLFAYIHLNPVKLIDPEWKEKGISDIEKTKEYLNSYKYSSYLDYIGQNREEAVILNKSEFPEYFVDFKEFDDFISEWLKYQTKKVTL